MPGLFCHIARFPQPIAARIAGVLTSYLHFMHGVPAAPYRVECTVFQREPGADDEWPNVRLRGQLPTQYGAILTVT